MPESPDLLKARLARENGVLCAWAGSGGFRKSARGLDCSRGPGPERGCWLGVSPEPHVFHSALCLERAPRRLSPGKQNRGGGGGRSWAGLGEGRWGLADCCLGNGN